jgi:hypothetical protein
MKLGLNLIVLSLLFMGSAHAELNCKLFSKLPFFYQLKVEATIDKLEKFGFSENIANKIIHNEPEIAEVIANGKAPKEIRKAIQYRRNKKEPTVAAVKVYRGLAIDLDKFDPNYVPHQFARAEEIYVTPSIEAAAKWAARDNRMNISKENGSMTGNSIVVVEFEVPDYLIYRGKHEDIIYSDGIKNQSNFVKRIGVIKVEDVQYGFDSANIIWK